MPIVRLGNHAAVHQGAVIAGEQITEMFMPTSDTLAEQFRTITHTDGLWGVVSAHDTPRWVWSDDKTLEAMLAAHFQCPTGEPEDAISKADRFLS